MKVPVFTTGANIRPPYGVVGKALEQLLALVDEGVEYPDAEARVLEAFQLTDKQCDAVSAAYAEHCGR